MFESSPERGSYTRTQVKPNKPITSPNTLIFKYNPLLTDSRSKPTANARYNNISVLNHKEWDSKSVTGGASWGLEPSTGRADHDLL